MTTHRQIPFTTNKRIAVSFKRRIAAGPTLPFTIGIIGANILDIPASTAHSSEKKSSSPGLPATRKLSDLPSPKGLPLLGNAHQIDSLQFHLSLEKWAQELGAMYRIRLGRKQILVVSDPDAISHLLRDRPDAIRRSSRTATALTELGTAGLFTAEGEDWRKQRKLVMRALTPEVVRNFFPTLAGMTERLLLRWQSTLAAGRPVDVLRDLKAYTLDVTIGLAMGQDINTLEHDANPLQRDIEQIFNRLARRLTAPFPYWRYVKLSPDRAADDCVARIAEAVTGFVAQARRQLDAHPERQKKPTNLLEALVIARDEPGSEFSDSDVIGNAVTMVFAGEDTTSNTIAWLLNFVARDPRAAERIAAEADAVLGSAKVLQEYGALDRFGYTEAATNEAMRIKPVAPFLSLETNRELVIGDTLVPQRTLLLAVLRQAGKQEADFSQANQFRPERWLDQSNTSASDPARKLFPFGGGPRFCPGRFLAMAEIKMVMSMMMRNFTLKVDAGAPPVRELFTFTMTPSALPLLLVPRR